MNSSVTAESTNALAVNKMQMFSLSGLPDFKPGMDLVQHLIDALSAQGEDLQHGDILVVGSDGLWDNLHRRNIVDLVKGFLKGQ